MVFARRVLIVASASAVRASECSDGGSCPVSKVKDNVLLQTHHVSTATKAPELATTNGKVKCEKRKNGKEVCYSKKCMIKSKGGHTTEMCLTEFCPKYKCFCSRHTTPGPAIKGLDGCPVCPDCVPTEKVTNGTARCEGHKCYHFGCQKVKNENNRTTQACWREPCPMFSCACASGGTMGPPKKRSDGCPDCPDCTPAPTLPPLTPLVELLPDPKVRNISQATCLKDKESGSERCYHESCEKTTMGNKEKHIAILTCFLEQCPRFLCDECGPGYTQGKAQKGPDGCPVCPACVPDIKAVTKVATEFDPLKKATCNKHGRRCYHEECKTETVETGSVQICTRNYCPMFQCACSPGTKYGPAKKNANGCPACPDCFPDSSLVMPKVPKRMEKKLKAPTTKIGQVLKKAEKELTSAAGGEAATCVDYGYECSAAASCCEGFECSHGICEPSGGWDLEDEDV